jgi:DNA-binding XRE family transcriptional regulator
VCEGLHFTRLAINEKEQNGILVDPKPKFDIDHSTRDRDILIRQAIADLIRTQRKERDIPLTQERLAGLSGISFEHLNHIENYKSTASIEVLDKIARALGFNRVSDLLSLDKRRVL